MSHAVRCGECEETIWPPHEATGPGGQTAIAAHRLALEHVRERGHTHVRVTPGCYYTGDGERPNAFGDGVTDPEDVAVPKRLDLADCVDDSARSLRDMADFAEDHDNPTFVARHLRQMAEAIETHLPDDHTDTRAGDDSSGNTETTTSRRSEPWGERD